MNPMIVKIPIFGRIILVAILLVLFVIACAPLASQPVPTQTPTPVTPTDQSQSTPVSDVPVIIWHREGGFAGFCDDVTIYNSGKAHIVSCKSSNPTDIMLSPDQLSQLNGWKTSLKGFTYSHKDDAVADAMAISLVFAGTGLSESTDNDYQAISSFVSSIAIQAGH